MVLGKIFQVLGKNWPHPLSHACAPVCALGCWALPASLLPSLKERALRSLLAVHNPYHSPGSTGQDMATRMDLAVCGPQGWYSECLICHNFHLQGSQVVPTVPSSSTDFVGLWRVQVSKAPALQHSPVEPRCECVWDSAEELLGPSCLPRPLSGEVKDNVLRQSVMDGRARPEMRRRIAPLAGGARGRLKGRGSAFPGAVQSC